jgi:hypothetical protein
MADDLYSTPEHESFRRTARQFAEQELRPRTREFDAMGRFDKSLFKRMGELGFLGLRYDPKWGGSGLDWTFTAVLFEELARAVRAGDEWVINGSKIYITNAATADWLCLLAVTDANAGYGGFSQIIVPTNTPGFRYELLDKIGNLGSDTGQLYFEDVRVPVGGLNPAGCAAAARVIYEKLGVRAQVAHIEGDDLLPKLEALQAARGAPRPPGVIMPLSTFICASSSSCTLISVSTSAAPMPYVTYFFMGSAVLSCVPAIIPICRPI